MPALEFRVEEFKSFFFVFFGRVWRSKLGLRVLGFGSKLFYMGVSENRGP